MLEALLRAEDNRVQGFLGPGHVCTVMGTSEYEPISRHFHVPIVVTGFEPLDLLEGILRTVRQLEEGRGELENQYARVCGRKATGRAQAARRGLRGLRPQLRGLGLAPASGYTLRPRTALDAEQIYQVDQIKTEESALCISGQVLKGLKKPHHCPAFGSLCTPQNPLGATMVSSEAPAPRTMPMAGT